MISGPGIGVAITPDQSPLVSGSGQVVTEARSQGPGVTGEHWPVTGKGNVSITRLLFT